MRQLKEYLHREAWKEDWKESKDRASARLEELANVPLGRAAKIALVAAGIVLGAKGCHAVFDIMTYDQKGPGEYFNPAVVRKVPALQGYDAMLFRGAAGYHVVVARIGPDKRIQDKRFNAFVGPGLIRARDYNADGAVDEVEYQVPKEHVLRKVSAEQLNEVERVLLGVLGKMK